MSLGKKIQMLKQERGFSAEFCAEQLGVDIKTWWNWERDKRVPNVFFICCMAKLFVVTTDELLKDENGIFIV